MLLAVARFPVSAQSEGADELLLAAAAFVGPLVVVQPLMQLEVVPRAELLLTYVARKLLSRVNSHMSLELGGLRETLAAILAFKRLFARVEPQMRLQGSQKTDCRNRCRVTCGSSPWLPGFVFLDLKKYKQI